MGSVLSHFTHKWTYRDGCGVSNACRLYAKRLSVHEAALSRRLFNIKYLLKLAEVTDIEPVLVGSCTMFNNIDLTTELEVQVTLVQEVINSQIWSTCSTFSTFFTVGFSVGVPQVASKNGSISVSHECTISATMGTTITKALQFQTTYRVKAVPPRTKVQLLPLSSPPKPQHTKTISLQASLA